MSHAATSKSPRSATIVLWSARILTCAILAFWGFFIVAHLIGDAGDPSRPLTAADYTSLTAMIASLLGLGMALKWERLGALIALVAALIGAVVNPMTLLFPISLIPVTAALFLIYSFLRNRPTVGLPRSATGGF